MRRAVTLLLLVVLATCWLSYLLLFPLRTNEVFIDIPAGTTARSMGHTLEGAGVVRSEYAFLLLRLIRRGKLQAGEYRFAEAASTLAVYTRIQRGDVYTRTLVVPEGFNLFDIAGAVQDAGLASSVAFIAAARTNVDLIAPYAPGATSLEGFLYPDTYQFSRHATPRMMQQVMVRRFQKAAGVLHLSADLFRTVTLASLVEKEVRFDDERKEAAAVFYNRLRLDMPLQTDPSVIYGAQLAGRWTGVIHRSDLQDDSPYNTYRHRGLTPGPICSPGAAALAAAMHPATTENLYFVAQTNGHTLFAKTLQEHTANVAAYRSAVSSGVTP